MYPSEQMAAALAYDKKARQMHGPRALVNFPDEPRRGGASAPISP